MVAYLVNAIFTTFNFDEFLPTQDLSLYFPIQFRYTQFWKHKFTKNIQLIHDYLLSLVHPSLFGKLPGRISSATRDFLSGKGEISFSKHHAFICLFGFEGHLSFFPGSLQVNYLFTRSADNIMNGP
jgi:hypothetical protein